MSENMKEIESTKKKPSQAELLQLVSLLYFVTICCNGFKILL